VEMRECSTFSADIEAMKAWLVQAGSRMRKGRRSRPSIFAAGWLAQTAECALALSPVAAVETPVAAFMAPLRAPPFMASVRGPHPAPADPVPAPATAVPITIGPNIAGTGSIAHDAVSRRRRGPISIAGAVSITAACREYDCEQDGRRSEQLLFHK
jgi:hypothetical protein